MQLIKIAPNQGRGTRTIYINSQEILKVEFSGQETDSSCTITMKDGTVYNVFERAVDIFDAVNAH